MIVINKSTPQLTINDTYIAKKEADLKVVEERMRTDAATAQGLREDIGAAKRLLYSNLPVKPESAATPEPSQLTLVPSPPVRPSMSEAIDKVVNDSATLVSYDTLRAALMALGFEKKQLSTPYFYTAVSRLKEKERIKGHPNGLLGKG